MRAPIMNSETGTKTNLERLQGLLKNSALAERLVSARMAAAPGEEQSALRDVILDRLEELRLKHGSMPDQ
jgi:hypothetical protein